MKNIFTLSEVEGLIKMGGYRRILFPDSFQGGGFVIEKNEHLTKTGDHKNTLCHGTHTAEDKLPPGIL